MTDIQRLDLATNATSKCLPATGAIELRKLYDAVKMTGAMEFDEFRAAVSQLVDRGVAEYQGADGIVRALIHADNKS